MRFRSWLLLAASCLSSSKALNARGGGGGRMLASCRHAYRRNAGTSQVRNCISCPRTRQTRTRKKCTARCRTRPTSPASGGGFTIAAQVRQDPHLLQQQRPEAMKCPEPAAGVRRFSELCALQFVDVVDCFPLHAPELRYTAAEQEPAIMKCIIVPQYSEWCSVPQVAFFSAYAHSSAASPPPVHSRRQRPQIGVPFLV